MIVATTDQLERAELLLAGMPEAVGRAMSRAMNAAAAVGRDSAVKKIAATYAVKADDIRSKIEVSKATPGRLEIAVTLRSRSLSMGYFPHSPVAAGTGGRGKPPLQAEIRRGEEKDVKGAFVAQLNSGLRIMIRTGGKTASGKAAMRSVYTVPFAGMLGATPVRVHVETEALEKLDAQLDREIDRALAEVAP